VHAPSGQRLAAAGLCNALVEGGLAQRPAVEPLGAAILAYDPRRTLHLEFDNCARIDWPVAEVQGMGTGMGNYQSAENSHDISMLCEQFEPEERSA
jgi:hypothetical protein